MAKVYRLKKELFVREAGNEVIIITEASVVYILKNGRALYKLISQGCSFELLAKLFGERSKNKEETEYQLLNLVNNLKDSGLIEEIEKSDYQEKSIKLGEIKGETLPVLKKIDLKELTPEGLITVGCISACGDSYTLFPGYMNCTEELECGTPAPI